MNDQESFMTRWSRRKRAATPPEQRETSEQAEKSSVAPDRAATGARDARLAPNAPRQTPVVGAPEPAFDIAKLPPLESITAATDIKGFLAAGVPPELTRAALRRVWAADPKIRDFVGLAEYAWDFNAPDSMPGFGSLEMTDELRREVEKLVGRSFASEESNEADASAKSPEKPARREISTESVTVEKASPQGGVASLQGGVASSEMEARAASLEADLGAFAGAHSADDVSVAMQHESEKPVEVNVTAKKRHGSALPD